MVKFYRGSSFGTIDAKYYEEYIQWFIDHLDDSYHVLFEVFPKEGTEIDIIILHESGIYVIEVKNCHWIELTQNGRCIYRDTNTGKPKKYFRENPFDQVKRQVNDFTRWLKKEFDHLSPTRNHKNELKVLAAVLSPKVEPPPKKVEAHFWAKPCNGPSDLDNILKKKWLNLRISPDGLRYIISEHRLSEISTDDLLTLTQQEDWWLEGESIREFIEKWSNLLAKKVTEENFQGFMHKFIDLKLKKQFEGQEIESEIPLTKLRRYRLPVIVSFPFPFFQVPGEREIIDRSLTAQGIDEFEKPFAEWIVKWEAGKQIYHPSKKHQIIKNNQKSLKNEFQPSCSVDSIYRDFLQKNAWIFGSAGSGKSYCARRIWGLLIEDFLNKEIENIPLLLDCGSNNFSANLNYVIDKSNKSQYLIEAFIRYTTKIWCHYDLPKAIYGQNVKLFLIIDAVDEIDDLEALRTILTFINNNNIPYVLFCREGFFDEIKLLINQKISLFNLELPDERFRNSILNKKQLELFGSLSSQVKQLLNLPIHLASFSNISEDHFTNTLLNEGFTIHILTKRLMVHGIRKKFGIIKSEIENFIVNKSAAKVSEGYLSKYRRNTSMDKVLAETIVYDNYIILVREILQNAGLILANGEFTHQLYIEILLADFLLRNDLNIGDYKFKRFDIICRFCKNLFGILPKNEKNAALIRIQKIFSSYITGNPYLVAELYFPGSLTPVALEELLTHLSTNFLVRSRKPLQDNILNYFDFFGFKDDLNTFPAIIAVRILSNPHISALLKARKLWNSILDNLFIFFNEARSAPPSGLENLCTFDLFDELIHDPRINKGLLIDLLGATRDIKVIETLITFLNDYSKLDYKDKILNAIKSVGSISEPILLHTLKEIANPNVQEVLVLALGNFRCQDALPLMMELLDQTTNVILKRSLIVALSYYCNDKINEKLISFFHESNEFEKRILFSGFSCNPTKAFIDLIFSIKNEVFFKNQEEIVFTAVRRTGTPDIIKDFLKFLKSVNIEDKVGITLTLLEIAKRFPDNETIIVEELKTLYADDINGLLVSLRDLGGEIAIDNLLKILKTTPTRTQQEFLFQIISQKPNSVKIILNFLEKTTDLNFATELIRVIGLLGLGETLEPLLNSTIAFQDSLSEIITWAVFRIGLRHPKKIVEVLEKNQEKPNKCILNAIALLRNQVFIRPLRKIREKSIDKQNEYFFLSHLLRCGDKQIIPRALSLLEKNIPVESKKEIIRTLTFIEDEESKDFLFDLINDENEDPHLKAEAQITLTHLHDERIVPYWVKILQSEKFPINVKEIRKLVINLPYLPITAGISFIAERIISSRLNSLLIELIPEIKEINWIEKFPFLKDILAVQINEEDSNQFFQYLKSKNIDLDQGKTFSIKKASVHSSRKFMSFMSINYIRIPSRDDFYQYLQDRIIQEITPFSYILNPILNRDPEKIGSIIRNSENKLLLLLLVLCLRKYPKKQAISLLIVIINDNTNTFPIRRAAFRSLLYHYAAFPELLSSTQCDNFTESELLEILNKLNPQSSNSQKLALSIHSKTQNIRLKLYSSLKCGDNKIMNTTLEAVYPHLAYEKDILLVNDLIINYKLISLLDDVLNYLINSKSSNIKNSCVKVLKRLNIDEVLISLYHAYHAGKITNIPDYELKTIFEGNLSKKLLKEIIGLTSTDLGTLDNKSLLKLIIKSRNIEFWNELMNILEKIGFESIKYELYGIEEFIPHVNLKKLEAMCKNESNDDTRNYLLNLLIYSGKRKYVKEWLKINEENNFENTRGIGIRSNYQHDVIDVYVSNLSDTAILKTILTKIYWRNDLIGVDIFTRLKERITDPEIAEIIEDEIMNQFHLIY